MFKTLVYPEHWYIQMENLGILRTLVYLEPEVYSESWYIQNSATFRTLVYLETWYIQNPETLGTQTIIITLPNIYDGAFPKNS